MRSACPLHRDRSVAVDHVATPGECILSIADSHGGEWEKIWGHEKNSGLRAKRRRPTVLNPGDVVHVPASEGAGESAPAEEKHGFRLHLSPARLRVRLLAESGPLRDAPYTLDVEGTVYSGRTDGEGFLADEAGETELRIPPSATEGKLRLGEDLGVYLLQIGWMTPVDEASGLEARLYDLGFHPGAVDGRLERDAIRAMQTFQAAHASEGLKKTSKPDEDTRRLLEREFGG